MALRLLVCVTASVIACRSPERPQDAPVVRIGIGLGPSARAESLESFAQTLYLEPLVRREVDGRAAPHLVESWQWEAGDRRLRLRLKRDVKLHNGEAMTAQLITRFLQDQVSTGRARNGAAYPTVEGIREEGEEIVIGLSQPDVFLLSELLGNRFAHPDDPEIGSGPFKLLPARSRTEMVRFDDYHDGAPRVGGVHILSYDTQRSAWAALLRGEIDAVQEVSRESIEFLQGSSDVRTYSFLQPFYIPVVFNLRHPVLQNVEVRRALTEAIDRDGIVNRTMKGLGQRADGPLWPLHWAFSPPPEKYRYDPAAAGKRLDRAGYPLARADSTGQRKRFAFRCIFWSEDAMYERIALTLQRQWFDVGVDVILEPMPFVDLWKRMQSGDFDAYMVRTNSSRSLDLTYYFWHSLASKTAQRQQSGYAGADSLLEALRRSTSDEDVRRTVAALSRRFHQDVPAVFIAWTEISRAVDARFDVPATDAEDPFVSMWRWRPHLGEPPR